MPWSHIIVHHSWTRDTPSLSLDAIRRYHVETNGWSDIGYHWVVELVQKRFEVIMGRPLTRTGAHAIELDMNHRAIGICLVGKFDNHVPPAGLLDKTEQLILWLQATYKIPGQNILGHRDVGMMAGYDWQQDQYKSCPGASFPLQEFKERFL